MLERRLRDVEKLRVLFVPLEELELVQDVFHQPSAPLLHEEETVRHRHDAVVLTTLHPVSDREGFVVAPLEEAFGQDVERNVLHRPRDLLLHEACDALFEFAREPLMALHRVPSEEPQEDRPDEYERHHIRQDRDEILCQRRRFHRQTLTSYSFRPY